MRSPEDLASWARERAGVDQPWYLVSEIIGAFDLGLEVRPGLEKSGMLDLIDGQIAVVVRSSGMDAKRFSAAHELGHFLLAHEEGLPLIDQLHDPKVERYCNEFASHLLIPRHWLRDRVLTRDQSFDTALDVAFQSQASLTSVLLALKESAGWRRDLLKWERANSSWNLTRAPSKRGYRSLRSSAQTQVLLDGVDDSPMLATVHFSSNEGEREIEIELLRLGRSIFGLVGGH